MKENSESSSPPVGFRNIEKCPAPCVAGAGAYTTVWSHALLLITHVACLPMGHLHIRRN